ncbi:malonyl-ACP O-methyltransferase BioC [Thalassotalea sediminis]|uniref:malonyl-ACP O-methyltransferase BioC n=1 Tax=Thalassotalea sediminis TaxID=1759089 RepID=UPI002573594E|nr:malonyl-ACP O-methyltransferase BioC [Thalassotalea sediminis]
MVDLSKRINIAKSFGLASKSYDISARLQRFSGKQLMTWLPNRHDLTVLDLGCGTGFFTDILAGRYQKIIGLDISSNMLSFASSNRNNMISWLEADAYHLPLATESVDLVYSNLMIQWCDALEDVVQEVLRVLKPGGLFIFSTLVDGTLHELKSSWQQVDNDRHVIDFKTTAQLKHACSLDNSKLLEFNEQPIVLEYENVMHLAKELKGLGANHVPEKLNRGLAGKDKWQQMMAAYKAFVDADGVYPATYRVFSGMVVKLNG